MKKQRDYSLTAKERKAKRAAAEEKKFGYKSKTTVSPVKQQNVSLTPEQAMLRSQRQAQHSALVIGGVVALAVLLIVIALIVPVIMYIVNPYRGYNDVIARFNLSNGMVLEYVIDEEEYDTAATNFIFLAKNGYFDNTVFYDAQGGWLRFGGYDAQPTDGSTSASSYERTKHRSNSESFCKSFDALASSKFRKVTDKFGYRLRADRDGKSDNVIHQIGALTFRYNDTATEFQFYYGDYSEVVPGNISGIECTMVGHALNDETIKNIQSIRRTAADNTAISSGYKWRPPTPNIKIESVKVYNLDDKKWKDFDFLKYMDGNDVSGSRRLVSWVGKQ